METTTVRLDDSDLAAQNSILREVLAVKREQISDLRTSLLSSTEAAEKAVKELKDVREDSVKIAMEREILNARCEALQAKNDVLELREKYENEKRMHAETIEKLKKELEDIKEETVKLASENAAIAARCRELQAKNDFLSLSMRDKIEERMCSEANEKLRKELKMCKEEAAKLTDENATLAAKCEELKAEAENEALANAIERKASAAENERLMKELKESQELVRSFENKREQIRTVLLTNKEEAEKTLISLRDKYEQEKSVHVEIVEKLRNQLKGFKDAATFSSHRAVLTERCEELQAKVELLEAEQKAYEEEKKDLNGLLRLAIQQKLTLNERLNGAEVDRRNRIMPRRSQRLDEPDTEDR